MCRRRPETGTATSKRIFSDKGAEIVRNLAYQFEKFIRTEPMPSSGAYRGGGFVALKVMPACWTAADPS